MWLYCIIVRKTLEKTEGPIKNRQLQRHTLNTKHRTNTNNTNNTNIHKQHNNTQTYTNNTIIHKHTQTTQTTQTYTNNTIICEPSYKQLDVKTNWTSFVCGHRNLVAVQIRTIDREICQHNVIFDLTYCLIQKEWVFY